MRGPSVFGNFGNDFYNQINFQINTRIFFLTDDKSFISGLTENSDHRFEMSKNDFLEFLLVLEQTVRFL